MWFSLVFLLVAGNFKAVSTKVQQKYGKVNITTSSSSGFYCHSVRFLTPFRRGRIRVFPSLSNENNPNIENHASVAVVDSVDYNSFSVCLIEPAQPTGKLTLNWFAFSDGFLPRGILTGSVSYNVFTSGSICTDVIYARTFDAPPKIFLSIRHDGITERKDVMLLWAEDVTKSQFHVCLRELVSFSGSHENLHLDWVAMENTFSENMTDLDSVVFPNTDQPHSKENYAYCQVRNFTRRFYEPPAVLVSAHRRRGLPSSLADQNIVTWVKDVSITAFEVCIKALPGINGYHEPITVNYAAVGDLDPCLDVTCDKFAVCRAFGPYDARCVCVTDCPSIEENVCASNGRSFINACFFQLEVCQTKANYTYYHHGSCKGFPMIRGRKPVHEVPRWSDSHCQTVQFERLKFYPDKPVHVQISVSHVNENSQIHDAAVSWVENVNDNNFTFCVMESGRNEGPPHGFATVEYMAYQGAPSGGLAGVEPIPEWWTGTDCQNVDITPGSFSSTPTVLVTAEHHRLSLKHDAASLWLEDVTNSSFKVCLRELQNFDGPHHDIYVNWLAFETLEQQFFAERASTNFAQTSKDPTSSTNYAQCQDVFFLANYSKSATVLVSPKHNTSGRNVDPKHNAITAWVEGITNSSFEICFKELHSSNGYDAVTVSHVVLRENCESNWVYNNGFCYKKESKFQTWSNASLICLHYRSNLVGVETAEEDVFVQHLHHEQPSWIGLYDQANDGVYLWTDGGSVSYTHWAPGQPQMSSTINEEGDCVESLGRNMKYYWQPSQCTNVREFTCKKDCDECSQNPYRCHKNADCINTIGSYTCLCRSGYTGDGTTCTDIDECSENTHECDQNADCFNTASSYTCQCRVGYSGDGNTCTDIDECSENTHECDQNADCANTASSYTCQCQVGFTGDGNTCTDIDECSENTHECDQNADCANTVSSYRCQCRVGYTGDGNTCTEVDECSLGTHSCGSNADCSNTNGSYTCYCRSGYRGDGHSCLRYCGNPGEPSRGYARGSTYTEGSTVYFYCSYSAEVLSGSSQTRCQPSGTWTNPTPPRCSSLGVRLVGASVRNKGRVEIYHSSYGWGTVCDDAFEMQDGNVICRQLGYKGASTVRQSAFYGQGSGEILLDDLGCSGSESFIWSCSHGGWKQHNCGHGEDASVECY